MQPRKVPAEPHFYPIQQIPLTYLTPSASPAGELVGNQAPRAEGSPPRSSLAPRGGTAPSRVCVKASSQLAGPLRTGLAQHL